MKKKYIKLQVECMQIQHENHLLAGSGNENDHADSRNSSLILRQTLIISMMMILIPLKIIRSYGTISLCAN